MDNTSTQNPAAPEPPATAATPTTAAAPETPATPAKGPNGLAIAAAILMLPGIILTVIIIGFEIRFISENPNLSSGFDTIAGLIATLLIFVEIYYVFTVLMTKLGTLPYEPQKMKKTTILMLILNCLLLVCCSAAVGMFEDWVPQGYITLADILRFTSVPGMAIKMVALAGQL